MCPPLMPNFLLRISRTGTIAFVVHDAAEIISSSSFKILLLTPFTIFFILPLAGAVKMTLDPPDLR